MKGCEAMNNLQHIVKDVVINEPDTIRNELNVIDEPDTIESQSEPKQITLEQVENLLNECSVYTNYDGLTFYSTGISLKKLTEKLNKLIR